MTEIIFTLNMVGKNVYLSGTFNNWKKDKMTLEDNIWKLKKKLQQGIYYYKFIVDDEWQIDTDKPYEEKDGHINNKIIIDKTKYISEKLINIDNDKLELNKINTNNSNIKIISILGDARMGKSTLLNCIISKYTNSNNNIFRTSSTLDHCTQGIDCVFIPELNILFCDVQGLKVGNSANDPKLLLITYLMSDIIIFTQPKMLNKSVLESFAPLSSFLTYIDFEQLDKRNCKPKLIFRISDFTLSGTAQENLDKLLVEHEDQSKNIIINMKRLFKDITAYNTNPLDRSELKLLAKTDFYGLFNSPENGFDDFINIINTIIYTEPSKISFNEWYHDINEYIKIINSNKKIDFHKLDTYQLLTKLELSEYISELRKNKPELFSEITIDHTQKQYDEKIVPRQKMCDNIIKEFNTRFSMVNDNLKLEKFNELKKEIYTPIENAIKSNYDQGYNLLNINLYNGRYMDIVTPLNYGNLKTKNGCNYPIYAKNNINGNNINDNVMKKFNTWCEKIENEYKTITEKYCKIQEEYFDDCLKRLDECLNNIDTDIKVKILMDNNNFELLYETNLSILNKLKEDYDKIINDIIKKTKHINFSFSLKRDSSNFENTRLNVDITETFLEINQLNSYNTIYNKLSIYHDLTNIIYTIINDSEKYIISKKKQLLNKVYNNELTSQQNSDIARINDFIQFYKITMDKELYYPKNKLKNAFKIKQVINNLCKDKIVYYKNNLYATHYYVYPNKWSMFINDNTFETKYVCDGELYNFYLNKHKHVIDSINNFNRYIYCKKILKINKNNEKTIKKLEDCDEETFDKTVKEIFNNDEVKKSKLKFNEEEYKKRQELIGAIEGQYKLRNKIRPIGIPTLPISRLEKILDDLRNGRI